MLAPVPVSSTIPIRGFVNYTNQDCYYGGILNQRPHGKGVYIFN